MKKTKTIDLFPFASSEIRTRFGMPVKTCVILIRWPVVIICSYLLLYPSGPMVPQQLLNLFILLYIGSNVALYFVGEEHFGSRSFYTPLVLADTIVLTLSLVINGHTEADFYLTYFLLIIICCIFDNPKILAIISVLAPIAYALLLIQSTAILHPSVFLRLPFLFVVGLFYGYFTQLVRVEKALKEEAEQRHRGKKEALDILSHEFRTPLNLISGYAQALNNKVFGSLTQEQERAVSKIIRQSDHLAYMVNSILDLARMEAGELPVQWDEFQVSEFLRQIRRNYEFPLEKPVSLHWSIDSDLPTIRTDKTKLTIVLQNLINNAIKFTDEGEIRISARRSADSKGVEFEIADSGIGISKEEIPVIFDKFRQGDTSATRHRGGVGLGLHIVGVFTELLGGKIKVQSELNRGSRFSLWLPANGFSEHFTKYPVVGST
jgi:signal transduction histidine kinase